MQINNEFSVCQTTNIKSFQTVDLVNAYAQYNCKINVKSDQFYDLFGTIFDLEKPTIIDICGLPHANVSMICLKMCLKVINYGKDVLYVDTKNVMSPSLIRNYYNATKIDYKNTRMSHVCNQFYIKYILDENDFEKFFSESTLKLILEKYSHLKLIVIDGICNPFRSLTTQERALKIQSFLNIINKFLISHNLLILITSNFIVDIVDNTLLPVPGDSYSHRVHHRFLFDKNEDKFVLFK